MRRFADDHPILIALGLVAIYFSVLAAPALFASTAFGGDPNANPQTAPAGQLPLEVALAATVLAAVLLIGWGRPARVTSRPAWGGVWYALPPLLVTLAILAAGLVASEATMEGLGVLWSAGFIQGTILLVILVGIFEETLFRGVVLHGFERRLGAVAALLISSVLFGAMHYVNWIGGQSLGATHQQVIHAALSGFLYGAIALRTRSIWPGVLLHALWDFTVMFNAVMLGDADVSAPAGGAPVVSFIIQYFEPILGLVAFYGWWRWTGREDGPAPRSEGAPS